MARRPSLKDIRDSLAPALASTLRFAAVGSGVAIAKAALQSVLGEPTSPATGIQVALILACIWGMYVFASSWIDISRARQVTSRSHFPASAFYSLLCGGTVAGFLIILAGIRAQGGGLGDQLPALGFVVFGYCLWPRTIHCSETAVSQRKVWGRKVVIPYSEVESVAMDTDGTVLVIGKNETIQLTKYHSNAAGFHSLMSERTGRKSFRHGSATV